MFWWSSSFLETVKQDWIKMKKYIQKRLLQLFGVLLGVTFLTFLLTELAPSDAAEMKYLSMGMMPSKELLEQTRREMGLYDPIPIQYVRWLLKALSGDLGDSVKYGEPVLAQLSKKLPMTLQLAGSSLIVSILISFPLALFTARKKNRVSDYLVRIVSFVGISMPNFWLGLLLMYVFAVKLRWLPVISTTSVQGILLPVMTLSIPMVCSYTRQMRTAFLEELGSAYVIGARARGVSESKIMLRHVLPNAIFPVITMIGLSAGSLLGGAAVIETIFSWQGIGNMVVEAIRVRDYPLIQGYVIWMAFLYVIINLLVDVLYKILDPQVRLKRTVK